MKNLLLTIALILLSLNCDSGYRAQHEALRQNQNITSN